MEERVADDEARAALASKHVPQSSTDVHEHPVHPTRAATLSCRSASYVGANEELEGEIVTML